MSQTISGMRLSAEDECILLCLGHRRDAAQEDRLGYLLCQLGPDWSSLWTEAERFQVMPGVSRAITTLPTASSLPDKLLHQAHAVRLQTMFSNMAIHGELARIAKHLSERGIPTTPLKGTYLAEQLYGALDTRRVNDIDLLVPESALHEARATLHEMGYANPDSDDGHDHASHGRPFVRVHERCTFLVQLHWKLTNPRFVTIDYSKLWDRILSNSPNEPALRPLPCEENLVYLAIHLNQDAGGGVLRLLRDIDCLVRTEEARLNWGDTLAVAEQWHGAWHLFAALHRAQPLFGTPVPKWVLHHLAPAPWRRFVIDLLVGPGAILRPTTSRGLYYHKFRLAHCAALSPFSRAWDAYVHYFLRPKPLASRVAIVGNAIETCRGFLSGSLWTWFCLAEALYRLAGRLGTRQSVPPPPRLV